MSGCFKEEHLRYYRLSDTEKKEYLQALSARLKEHEEVLFSYAHGSFLEEGPFSDLDIAVFLRPKAMPASRFHYEDGLAAELAEAIKPSFPLSDRSSTISPSLSIACESSYRMVNACWIR
jgi:predicted nucleotidyltransferase